MAGEAKVPYSAVFPLLQKVVKIMLVRIAVIAHRVFVDVMQQIKIEIFDTAALQLLFKYFLRLQFPDAGDILMPGELIRQIPAVPRIARKGLSDGNL